MKHFTILLLAVSILTAAVGSAASAQQSFEFKLGFKALAEQTPDVVGVPLENEHWGANGDSLQQTSKGLMAWRKADNWTAFTNGSRTWVNGPSGVMERANEERFDWEAPFPAAPQPGPPEPLSLKIGLLTPSKGGTPDWGKSMFQGFTSAVNDAHSAGNVRITTIQGIAADDPATAADRVRQMVSRDGIAAIVGPVTSQLAIPVSEIVQSSQVVMISPSATNARVTVDGGMRKGFVFRAAYVDAFQGRILAKYALESLGARTASIVYRRDSAYSGSIAEAFRSYFDTAGGRVASVDTYSQSDTDSSSLLAKVVAANPDVLLVPDDRVTANLIARDARRLGIKGTLLGPDAWDSSGLDVPYLNGAFLASPYSGDDPRPEARAWIQRYQEAWKSQPDVIATLTYDGTSLLIDAALRARSNNPDAIRQALGSTRGFAAVTGPITMEADGNPTKGGVILKIQDGKPQFVASIAP